MSKRIIGALIGLGIGAVVIYWLWTRREQIRQFFVPAARPVTTAPIGGVVYMAQPSTEQYQPYTHITRRTLRPQEYYQRRYFAGARY